MWDPQFQEKTMKNKQLPKVHLTPLPQRNNSLKNRPEDQHQKIEYKPHNKTNNTEKRQGTCHYCGIPGHFKARCRKLKRDNCDKQCKEPNQIRPPCDTCGRRSHTTPECYNGANWANQPKWWRTRQTPVDNIQNANISAEEQLFFALHPQIADQDAKLSSTAYRL